MSDQKRIDLSWDDIRSRAEFLAAQLSHEYSNSDCLTIYGVPRGGVYAAQALSTALWKINIPNMLTTDPGIAHLYIDDIIDSGKTREDFFERDTDFDLTDDDTFHALVDYQGRDSSQKGTWMSFPWERMSNDDGPVNNITRLIEYLGDDPEREGLKETPKRVIKSFDKLYGGYKQKVTDHIKVFENGSCDEMVLLKDIEFFSTCEHHMLPFFGKAHIAYIPDGKVIGISKLARILEVYTRRLQIQERICQQVTTCLNNNLKPLGAACILEAQHFCMTSRGVEKQNSIMVTSSLTGAFKSKPEARSEFLRLIHG